MGSDKVSPFGTRKKKQKMSCKQFGIWLFTVGIWILFMMWLNGMANHYFPDPVLIGLGQYLDYTEGIVLLGVFGIFALTGIQVMYWRRA